MITTKLLVPRTSSHTIQRTALYEKLTAGLQRKLIHISAPAGFGKTSLVSEWINHCGISASWYSLNQSDSDPVIFLSYLVAGLRALDPHTGSRTLELINAPQRPEIAPIVDLLIEDLQKINMEFLLVLDDYHVIESLEVHMILRMVLEHMPGHMHVAVLSRSDIPIPLSRIRSQNQLLELRSSELSFNEQETVTLFNKKLKFGLSADEINTLLTKTEGWIAGLQLSALSMQNKEDASGFIQDFAGDNRYIMDYLMEEVLSKQPDQIKDFLLRTSVLEQLSGSLCDALPGLDNGQAILESLEKNNLFIIPLDTERKWYRYHHLFADLLNQRAQKSPSIETGELHRNASAWFEKHHMPSFAIDHSLEMADYHRALLLLNAEVERLWEDGHHAAIIKYGELLPEDILEQHPRFCIFYSWALILGGMFREAQAMLQSAQTALTADKHGAYEKDDDLPGKLSVAFAFLYASSGNVGGIFESCQKATTLITEEQATWFCWAWYSCGLGNMMTGNLQESSKAFSLAMEAGRKTRNLHLLSTIGIRYAFCELQKGSFKSAYKICQELQHLLTEGDYSALAENEWSYAGLYTTMGHIEHEWAEGEALRNSKIGYELSCKGNDITSRVFSTIVYIRVLRFLGDLKKVEGLISELDAIQKERELFPYLLYTFQAAKLGAYVRFRKPDKAARFVDHHQLKTGDKVDEDNELLYTCFARMLVAESRLEEAADLLEKLHSLAKAANRRERLVETKILLAALQLIQEDKEGATAYLADSLFLAEEENLVMHFIKQGTDIAGILEEMYRAYAGNSFSFSRKFLGKVLRAIGKKTKQTSQASFYSLSRREIEVLRLMAEELSNQEIADQMYVSLNTVKAHAKNIHLKLEVDSRGKAAAKARELGLI